MSILRNNLSTITVSTLKSSLCRVHFRLIHWNNLWFASTLEVYMADIDSILSQYRRRNRLDLNCMYGRHRPNISDPHLSLIRVGFELDSSSSFLLKYLPRPSPRVPPSSRPTPLFSSSTFSLFTSYFVICYIPTSDTIMQNVSGVYHLLYFSSTTSWVCYNSH